MNSQTNWCRLLASTALSGAAVVTMMGVAPAFAQEQVEEIVVTGSRIRRAETTTEAPVTVINAEAITERGFVSAAQALNNVSSNIPSNPLASGSGNAAGSPQQFANLFGLGAGRTLTLVNGRRMVTSATRIGGNVTGDRVVDGNIIPAGLIERVDVVQAGGAAVYGSDAIAGVVNYVLKRNFEGIELDAQYGESSRSDYPQYSYRATIGRNFAEGRGNIAANFEYSKTRPLYNVDRPGTDFPRAPYPNPANTSLTDGQPPTIEASGLRRFWAFNNEGVIFSANPGTGYPAPASPFLVRSPGMSNLQGLQVSQDGRSFIPYNTGTGLLPGSFPGVPFASGGEGWDYREIAALISGVERKTGTVIGHYDLTPNVRVVGEFIYAQTEGRDPYGGQGVSTTILSQPGTGTSAIAFNRTNPFLTSAQIATLDAANATFRNGGNLFLSKQWADLVPSRESTFTTDTWRGMAGLEGDLNVMDRNFYYSLSYSRAETRSRTRSWAVDTRKLYNAAQAVRNGAGQIVCAINADAIATNDDPSCAPLNIFGRGTYSHSAMSYVVVPNGEDFVSQQDNVLATLGGDLFDLPAGPLKFSAAYEYRKEQAKFVPSVAQQRGLIGQGVPTLSTRGEFDTNEFSGELLAPLLGGDFTLPLVKAFDINGSYRRVDNSIAGVENVWGIGARWDTGYGLTFRASKSRNFRAPTLNQLFEPTRVALASIGTGGDPCDFRYINQGTVPSVRRANCLALFQANPGYGVTDTVGAGSSAQARLATFQSDAANFPAATITTGGNTSLRNEVSDTVTYGLIFQPSYIPGLTIVADRVEVDLTDGLSAFTSANFLATCFDSTTQPADICAQVTRQANGQIATGRTTTFNAGKLLFRGEVYNINYSFPIGRFFNDADLGNLELAVEATHTTRLEASVTGVDTQRVDGTAYANVAGITGTPDWVVRFDARYRLGPVRVLYTLNYLPETVTSYGANIETAQYWHVKENYRHSVSVMYDFRNYTFRAGVNNLTDQMPSWPTRSYGDILGRQYFAGVRARF